MSRIGTGSAALGVTIALIASGLLTALPMGALSSPSSPPASSAFGSGACTGGSLPLNLTGRLFVVGAPTTAPSIDNVSVRVAYAYQMSYVPNGGSTTVTCVADAATNATNSSGGVRLTAGVPASTCDRVSCTYYAGPFGPASFSTPPGPPPSYFLTSSRHGSSVTLDFVAALSRVDLAPWGRVTVSTFAPTPVHANATAGDGGPSPAIVSYAWRVSGTGWSVVAGEGNATVRVEGTTGGVTGTLVLWTNGTFGGGRTNLTAQTLLLDPFATSITSGAVTPTSLDAGGPATFEVLGTGAGGYPYAATVFPGLGLAAVAVPCTSTPALGGSATLSCRALVTYTVSGIAQPSANLTNGFSTATVTLATVEVAPALVLALGPDPALAYAGAAVALTLSASPLSGTAPLGPACVWWGGVSSTCSSALGPRWTFSLAFPSPGTYDLKGTVEDATGANRTVSGVALVFARPSLSALGTSTNVIHVGGSVGLTATLSGGALPSDYWWNDSLPSGTDASGLIAQDGPIHVDLSLATPGLHTITLSVRDALGTTVANLTRIVVLPGPAVALIAAGSGPSAEVTAGAPWTVGFCAVDPNGNCLPSYGTNVTLVPGPGELLGGGVWANVSGASIRPDANGSIDLPYSAWRNGALNVSLTDLAAGNLSFTVVADLPFHGSGGDRLGVEVGPDLAHPVLRSPHVARGGARDNATEYAIADPYGNPIRSGFVIVRTVFAGVQSDRDSPVRGNTSGGFVWVNYTAPSGTGGVVYVLSAWDVTLLPVLTVPSEAAAPSWTLLLVALAGSVTAATLGVAYAVRRRRRLRPGGGASNADVSEEELRRLAEGRAHILGRARGDRRMTLDELGDGFPGPPPTRAEVAEWVGGLVSEGALAAARGPDGEPRFVAVERHDPVPPRVEVDPDLLDADLGRRPIADDGDDAPADPGEERAG